MFCVFHASPELAVAGNARQKSVELNKERGVEKNDKTTLEMEGQHKVTKKNQSFLPLTVVQTGNEVAGAGKKKPPPTAQPQIELGFHRSKEERKEENEND